MLITEFIAAYNLLVHLIHQSPNVNEYLQPICKNLSGNISSTSSNKTGLALSVLSTIFNILPSDEPVRYPVFAAILDVVSRSSNYEALRPQLKHLDGWLAQWNVPATQQRRLYLRIATIAREAGEGEQSYDYLVRAIRTIPSADASGDEARKLSVDALKAALSSPSHFDFEDLSALDSIQGLATSEPAFYELLEIFTSKLLDDFNDFNAERNSWLEQQSLDDSSLVRKMRLLTLASLAASTGQTRSLPYASISDALQIPAEDVEMWVIDVIRAGLVEGKLSQLNQTFLIHRSTYRVFTQTQWREVAGRLDMWRNSLTGVLAVVRQEKENMIAQKEQELKATDSKLNDTGTRSGYRPPMQRDAIYVGMD